jgi:mannonate dehydratase
VIQLAEILLEPTPTPFWTLLRQVGVTRAVGILPRGDRDWRGETLTDQPWDLVPLTLYRDRLLEAGFELAVMEDNPPMDAIRLGRPGREEELDAFCNLVRNLGRLGVPTLCYNWMTVLGWVRTTVTRSSRGGALVAGYEHSVLSGAPETAAGRVAAEALWDNLRWFLERVLPVAEEAGVQLAMHPDDPPLSPIRGIDRIITTLEAFERLLELVPSDMNGITFCQGNFTLMTNDVPEAIRHFGAAKKIFFVHLRDVRGVPSSFMETFHDDGQTPMSECMRAYRDVGYSGVLRTDHVPALIGETAEMPGYSNVGRLHAIGYIAGLREAVYGRA